MKENTETKHNIILDTDIGGDPDDSFALTLGLNSEELDVNLIITSDENRGYRVEYLKGFLKEYNTTIPIARGTDLGNTRCCLYEYENTHDEDDYVEKVKEIVVKNYKNGEKTTYVCISPMSNLAKFIEKYPDFQNMMDILIMGGGFRKKDCGKVGHNVRYDIEAARKVLNSKYKQSWVMSDVTHSEGLRIDSESKLYNMLKSSNKNHLKMISKHYEKFWKALYPKAYLHDPITLMTLINKNVVEFEQVNTIMDEQGLLHENEAGNKINVSRSINFEVFDQEFYKRIFK